MRAWSVRVDGTTSRLGGFLQEEEHRVGFHSPVVPPAMDVYAGYLFITPVRHAAGSADLDDEETAAVGVAIARWSGALEAYGAEHVYVSCASGTEFRTFTSIWSHGLLPHWHERSYSDV